MGKLKVVFRRIRGRLVPIKVNPNKSARDLGDQVTRVNQKFGERELRSLDKKVKQEFGFTKDPREAGFIDRKGRLVDLSGKNQGGSPGDRVRDHREIDAFFRSKADNRTDNLFEFMKKTRSIRMSDHGGIFNADMVIKPNKKQEVMLKALTKRSRIIYGDRTTVKSSTVKSGEYKTALDMINDLFKKKKRNK